VKKGLSKREMRVLERALTQLLGADLQSLVGAKVKTTSKRKAA
jgi:hypothetical protein